MTGTDQPDDVHDPEVLQLGAILDLKAASPLHLQLLTLRGRDLVLDASEVSRLGGLCLQVLLSAVTAWRSDGRTLATTHPSDPFARAIELFGVRLAAHQELLA
jgi:chemotaxis protein CheX